MTPLTAMKKIVALVDFSELTPKVVDAALELALKFDGEVLLVHVVPPMPIAVDYAPAMTSDAEETEARLAQLQALRDSLTNRDTVVRTELLNGTVLDALLAHLPKLNPDFIVMGSHGHGALYNLVIGSVTQGIIKHAAWPVMIIPIERAVEPDTRPSSAAAKSDGLKAPPAIAVPAGAMLPP
ncbi:MAG: universal stress protein [Verrucomicrobiaceae bacterium]|nr:universal stress protein [Verrucomicrobiaceae bacterium]